MTASALHRTHGHPRSAAVSSPRTRTNRTGCRQRGPSRARSAESSTTTTRPTCTRGRGVDAPHEDYDPTTVAARRSRSTICRRRLPRPLLQLLRGVVPKQSAMSVSTTHYRPRQDSSMRTCSASCAEPRGRHTVGGHTASGYADRHHSTLWNALKGGRSERRDHQHRFSAAKCGSSVCIPVPSGALQELVEGGDPAGRAGPLTEAPP